MSQIALKLKDVSIGYNGKSIIDNINFEINEGEIVYLFGSNGSGKSTLVKTILGIVPALRGDIELFGEKNIQDTVSNYASYSPQYSTIDRDFPITVKEMIQLECINSKKCDVEAEGHLKVFNSNYLVNRKLNELSGGEFQKVLISRALIRNPKIIFFDEPTNNLDQNSEKIFFDLIKEMNEKYRTTFILISHDKHLIEENAHKMIEISGKSAKLITN